MPRLSASASEAASRAMPQQAAPRPVNRWCYRQPGWSADAARVGIGLWQAAPSPSARLCRAKGS